MGIGIGILLATKYRLERVHNQGVQIPEFNKISLYADDYGSVNAEFVEGFKCKEFLFEYYGGTASFRKQTLTPQLLYEMEKLIVIGNEYSLPQLRSRLALTTAPFGLKCNQRQEVFSTKIRDCDASHGIEIEAYNSTSFGTNTNIQFYDRDVKRIPTNRNILQSKLKFPPIQKPEEITDRILEEMRDNFPPY